MAMPQKIAERSADTNADRKLVGEFGRLQTHVECLEEQIEQLTDSISWKLTKPLRAGKLILNCLRSTFAFGQTRLTPKKLNEIVLTGHRIEIIGNRPEILLGSTRGWLPTSWVSLTADGQPLPDFTLYVDDGSGFSEDLAIRLNFSASEALLVKLPKLVRRLRLDPATNEAFEFKGIVAKPRWAISVLWSAARSANSEGQAWGTFIVNMLKAFSRGGSALVARKLVRWNISRVDYNRCYERWIKRYDTISDRNRDEMTKAVSTWQHTPLISILMPVYNTNPRWLRLAIDSVCQQIYTNWELCIVDDASNRSEVNSILAQYETDPKIRVMRRTKNGHICAATNDALDMARGEFLALMDHDDQLSPHALYHIVSTINRTPDADLLYSDEDRITGRGQRRDPYFKGGWNPELMLSQNLVSHLGVYRTKLARSIGGFRLGYEGSQDWDFALRFSEATSSDRIVHVPKVLYHWRLVPGTVSYNPETKVDAVNAAARSVSDHLKRRNVAVNVCTAQSSGVSPNFVLPANLSNRCLLIGCSADLEMAKRLSAKMGSIVKDVRFIEVSSLHEFLTHKSTLESEDATLLLYIGSEVAHVESGSIQALMAIMGQEQTGVVGSVSVSPDGTINQAGLVLAGSAGAFVAFNGLSATNCGYFGLERQFRRLSAVDSHLVMISREALNGIPPLVRQSDRLVMIELCLAITNRGLRILIEPRARCILALNTAAVTQDMKIVGATRGDPHYNPNLCQGQGGYFIDFER